MLTLKCKKLHPDAKLPTKAHETDLGWDLYCVRDTNFNTINQLWLEPNESHLFRTGVAIQIYGRGCEISWQYLQGEYGLILFDRSSLGGNLCVHRFAGVIDPSYTGEIFVRLTNFGKEVHIVNAGDKIVQAVITKMFPSRAEWADFGETDRGDKGFGTSGK